MSNKGKNTVATNSSSSTSTTNSSSNNNSDDKYKGPAAAKLAGKVVSKAVDNMKSLFVRKKESGPCNFDDKSCEEVEKPEGELDDDGQWENSIETPMAGDPEEAIQQKDGTFTGFGNEVTEKDGFVENE